MKAGTRWAILIGAVLGIVIVLAFRMGYISKPFDPMDHGSKHVKDEYVGETRAAILSRSGPPTHEWKGIYAAPPVEYAELHPEAITMIYQRPTGALYLAVEPINDVLTCFSSDWVPKGMILD